MPVVAMSHMYRLIKVSRDDTRLCCAMCTMQERTIGPKSQAVMCIAGMSHA